MREETRTRVQAGIMGRIFCSLLNIQLNSYANQRIGFVRTANRAGLKLAVYTVGEAASNWLCNKFKTFEKFWEETFLVLKKRQQKKNIWTLHLIRNRHHSGKEAGRYDGYVSD